jgi:hypothetical protein
MPIFSYINICRALIIGAVTFFVCFTAKASSPEISTCPSVFYSINLHNDAKLCQIFDSSKPASLIYHVNETPNNVVAFFLVDRRLTKHSHIHNRVLLMNADKTHRVVVSPDGDGSQVDILVIAPSV